MLQVPVSGRSQFGATQKIQEIKHLKHCRAVAIASVNWQVVEMMPCVAAISIVGNGIVIIT